MYNLCKYNFYQYKDTLDLFTEVKHKNKQITELNKLISILEWYSGSDLTISC